MGMVDFSLDDVGSIITSIREAITGEKIIDPNEKAKLILELDKLDASLKMGQMKINEVEAQHKSIFVAGWRPFIGWVSGSALVYNYILQPLIYIILQAHNIDIKMPILDIETLMMLMTGMLGFGMFRTYEKIKGVENAF